MAVGQVALRLGRAAPPSGWIGRISARTASCARQSLGRGAGRWPPRRSRAPRESWRALSATWFRPERPMRWKQLVEGRAVRSNGRVDGAKLPAGAIAPPMWGTAAIEEYRHFARDPADRHQPARRGAGAERPYPQGVAGRCHRGAHRRGGGSDLRLRAYRHRPCGARTGDGARRRPVGCRNRSSSSARAH